MHYLFLDTNIFLHFKDFEQIEWKKLLNNKDNIEIVFAPTVISELDKHKYSTNQNKSNRSKKISSKIRSFIKGNSNFSINISICTTRINEKIYIDNDLDKTNQDDCIIASILVFKNIISKNDKVSFVTDDTNSLLKCKILNIHTIELPDEYLIIEESEEKKKIKQLEKELYTNKNKLPVISLFFINGKNNIEIRKPTLDKLYNDFINEKMSHIKTNYRKLPTDIIDTNKPPINNKLKKSLQEILEEDKLKQNQRYNNELEEYYKEYESCIRSKYNPVSNFMNSLIIELELSNSGKLPADNIEIEFDTPKNCIILTEYEIPTDKEAEIIKIFEELFTTLPNSKLKKIVANYSLGSEDLKTTTESISISKKGESNITIKVSKLIHYKKIALAPIHLKFENLKMETGISIPYRIYLDNLPDKIEGTLNIKLV